MSMSFNLPFTMATSIKTLNKLSIDSSVFFIHVQTNVSDTNKIMIFSKESLHVSFMIVYITSLVLFGVFFSRVDAAVTIK